MNFQWKNHSIFNNFSTSGGDIMKLTLWTLIHQGLSIVLTHCLGGTTRNATLSSNQTHWILRSVFINLYPINTSIVLYKFLTFNVLKCILKFDVLNNFSIIFFQESNIEYVLWILLVRNTFDTYWGEGEVICNFQRYFKLYFIWILLGN
jgi:hypothetical protein